MFDWNRYEIDKKRGMKHGLRVGQACMEALNAQSPWLYEEACGGPVDPFYDDSLVQVFEDWLSAVVYGE